MLGLLRHTQWVRILHKALYIVILEPRQLGNQSFRIIYPRTSTTTPRLNERQ